ncbi:MAG: leucine--tRNA ligase [Zestosphaera sp.]
MITGTASLEDFVAYLVDIARKWSRIWEEERVYEADPKEGLPKYFLTAAFMYPNGPAHVGHARTYLIPDILARFFRGLGYNVLFPMGFHYTGTPILALAEGLATGDPQYVSNVAKVFQVESEDLMKLKDPVDVARFFHEISKKAMKLYGLSIDWRREFTTIDPEFKAFIRWQFKKLLDSGYLTRGSHPVGWCPRHNMPVGMHDTKDDVEPEIDEVYLIKFAGLDGLNYVVATLRPETVLGVTNIWVNPNVKYCIASVETSRGTDTWVLSCEAAKKLGFQRNVEIVREVSGEDLIGRKAVNPVTGRVIQVIEASFVDPKFGTGVVMSVPAHAPYDYVALRDYVLNKKSGSWEGLEPIPLIKVEGYSDIPAKDAVERLDIKSQEEHILLDNATKEVYRVELESGVMRSDLANLIEQEIIKGARDFILNEISGVPVKEAREKIKNFLLSNGFGDLMYDVMNAPVYCRCGTEIVVKIVKDQWFINYGDTGWKKLALEALSKIRLVPEEARTQFVNTIYWLREKACTRSRGLGTELPWAPGWIIESLSDSTIYMAFYTVIHKIREYGVPPEKLTYEFWDYVMLGSGEPDKIGVDRKVLEDLRREFLYWYPLDSRHSGKDLIPNHLTFFIFNHVAIFPESLWPRQIVANGWVLIQGEKMAKSRGNIFPLHWLVSTYSPDVVRLAIASGAEVESDLNLDIEVLDSTKAKLRSIHDLITSFSNVSDLSDVIGLPEKWLLSRFARNVLGAYEDLSKVRVRAACLKIFYNIHQDILRYLKMVEKPSRVLRDLLVMWLKVMHPVTPFITEELWHEMGMSRLLATERLPLKEELERMIDESVELGYLFLERFIDDLKNLSKIVKGNEAVVYVSTEYEYKHLIECVRILRGGGRIGDVIKYLVTSGFADQKQAPKVAKTLVDLVMSLPPELLEAIARVGFVDEYEILLKFRKFIEGETGIRLREVYKASDVGAPDYGGKKRNALPFRPSIMLVNSAQG